MNHHIHIYCQSIDIIGCLRSIYHSKKGVTVLETQRHKGSLLLTPSTQEWEIIPVRHDKWTREEVGKEGGKRGNRLTRLEKGNRLRHTEK